MEPGSENNEKLTNGEWKSTGIIKTEYGNNVEIKVEMAIATNGQSIAEASVGVVDKKTDIEKGNCKNFSRR